MLYETKAESSANFPNDVLLMLLNIQKFNDADFATQLMRSAVV